jgi:DNA-binding transcriptional MerR regulator
VSELAKRVNRSPDTIKRWVDDGLLDCHRDERNRRQFSEQSVDRCLVLARLSIAAQLQNRKLSELAAEMPEQLQLLSASGYTVSPENTTGDSRPEKTV